MEEAINRDGYVPSESRMTPERMAYVATRRRPRIRKWWYNNPALISWLFLWLFPLALFLLTHKLHYACLKLYLQNMLSYCYIFRVVYRIIFKEISYETSQYFQSYHIHHLFYCAYRMYQCLAVVVVAMAAVLVLPTTPFLPQNQPC